MEKTKRHRHERTSWLIGGGFYEWCYECGALRLTMKRFDKNGVTPTSRWCKPTGIGSGINPWDKWQKSKTRLLAY